MTTLERAKPRAGTGSTAAPVSLIRVAVLGALAALAAGLTVTATASAAFPEPGTAKNLRSLTLKLPVTPGGKACTTERPLLNSGAYRWQTSVRKDGGPWQPVVTMTVTLKHGTYVWRDCVAGSASGRAYDQWSNLTGPSRPSRAPFFHWTRALGTFGAQFGSTLKWLGRLPPA